VVSAIGRGSVKTLNFEKQVSSFSTRGSLSRSALPLHSTQGAVEEAWCANEDESIYGQVGKKWVNGSKSNLFALPMDREFPRRGSDDPNNLSSATVFAPCDSLGQQLAFIVLR